MRCLSAVLAKLFADRQVIVEANVSEYLVTRMERSFSEAVRIVAALDALALEKKVAHHPFARRLALRWRRSGTGRPWLLKSICFARCSCRVKRVSNGPQAWPCMSERSAAW